jgi:hypothetical protein
MVSEGIRRLRNAAVLTAIIVVLAGTAGAQQTSWHALPEGTLAAIRIPDARDFYDAIKSRTKLGTVLLDDRRIDALRRIVLRDSEADWERVVDGLARLGLKPDDLTELAAGEIGYAAGTTRGDEPLYVGLAWADCGEAVGDRLLAAVGKHLEQAPEGRYPITREKIELAGVAAEHIVVPMVGPKHGKADLSMSFKFGMVTDVATGVKPAPDVKKDDLNVVLGRLHLVVGRRGGVLLIAHAAVPEPEEGAKKMDPARGIDAVRGTFARFAEAHGGGGDDFVRRHMQTSGLSDALPEGVPLVEIVADTQAIIEAVTGGAVEAGDAASRDEFRRVVQALGFDKLGPTAYRTSLDGNVLRSGFFAALPQPRAAVAGLLDQTPLPPQPADWVAADVIAYQHLSFDFGSAYKLGAELAKKLSEKGEGGVAALETQVNGFLGVDPATLLGSLGRTHTVLTFTPADAVGPGDEEIASTALAFVWRITDQPLWERLLQKGSELSLRPTVREQGFSGLRFDDGKTHAGWFVGEGYMVAAIGKGVAERTLSMLRNPPRGEGGLLGSVIGRKAAELLPRDEAVAFELTDGPTMFKYFNVAMKKALDEAKDEEARRLKEIWPTDKELEGAVGVGVSAIMVDRNGLTYRSAAEMPPP